MTEAQILEADLDLEARPIPYPAPKLFTIDQPGRAGVDLREPPHVSTSHASLSSGSAGM